MSKTKKTKQNKQDKKREAEQKKFLETLEMESIAGNISMACQKSGVARNTIYYWRNKHPKFDQKVEEAVGKGRETLADMAENGLYLRILAGDTTAIIFTLKSLRRKQYGEGGGEGSQAVTMGAPKNPREAKLLELVLNKHADYVRERQNNRESTPTSNT